MTRLAAILACAAAVVVVGGEARAAESGTAAGTKSAQAAKPEPTKPEPAKPEETKPEPAKPEGTAPAKPEESAAPTPETAAPEAAPEGGPMALGDLTKEGFSISATTFVPADAVTRQSGKVSSDAVVVTLQKSTETAVCFYTLKAYVGKKLSTIPACTVHR
jgi:hypothetical protein